jgi:enamine deaminase RidA (YjgF/YER057c/UK114 family)
VSVERINPAALASPSGFSHAVRASGMLVFLAGQTAMDQSGRIVGDTVTEQFAQALENLLQALAAAGGAPDTLASMTIFTTDMDDYRAHAREIGAVWRRRVGTSYPAMAGIGVARLWDRQALVELQAIAVLDASLQR